MAAEAAHTQLADELTAILARLIAIPSVFPPGETQEVCDAIAARLRTAGYDVRIATRRAGVANVVAALGRGQPCLAFNVHIDTVGAGDPSLWATLPLSAVVRDGSVFGLGASNCKGAAAVQLWLAAEIARRGGPARGQVMFTFVGDEEGLGPDGTAFLRESGALRPDWLVVGAETENQLIVEERGVLWARLRAIGRGAHAGAPELGDNAIARMARVLAHLERTLVPSVLARVSGELRAAISVGTIAGGENTNVVPAACEATIDRRLLPEESVSAALDELRIAVAAAGEPPDTLTVDAITGSDGFRSRRDGALVSAFAAAIEARTGRAARFRVPVGVYDGRHFARDGIEILDFGPGISGAGHAPNESVPVASLVTAAQIQLDAVRRLVGLRSG